MITNKELVDRMEELEREELQSKVVDWGIKRGIVGGDKTKGQFMKVAEELGELAAGINKNDRDKIIDSMGDLQVTLILLSQDIGVDYNKSLESAYETIKGRKGKTINGVFVKEEDL